MEQNKQDATQRRRPYDEAFKRDAVRLVAEEGYSFKAAAEAEVAERVRCNRACRALWVGGKLAKRFLREAAAQSGILDAFQSANWRRRVQVALSLNGHPDPAHRLRKVVLELKKGLDQSLIRFRMEGSAEGVICDLD